MKRLKSKHIVQFYRITVNFAEILQKMSLNLLQIISHCVEQINKKAGSKLKSRESTNILKLT